MQDREKVKARRKEKEKAKVRGKTSLRVTTVESRGINLRIVGLQEEAQPWRLRARGNLKGKARARDLRPRHPVRSLALSG